MQCNICYDIYTAAKLIISETVFQLSWVIRYHDIRIRGNGCAMYLGTTKGLL